MIGVGLLGAGAIGGSLIHSFRNGDVRGHRLEAVLARSYQLAELRVVLDPRVVLTGDPEAFLAADAALVIETAGHAAAARLGPAILAAGKDLFLLSVGVLADSAVQSRLVRSAKQGGSRIVIPSGALAGFDGLRALAQLDLAEVTYTSIKPPRAWTGTPGEAIIRRQGADQTITLFSGAAARAALLYPKSANLAAAVAIAGIGLERTRVSLISDPSATANIGSVVARGRSGEMRLTLGGAAFDANPRSSQITKASIIAALDNRLADLYDC